MSLDANELAQIVRTSPYFDAEWYRQENPEIEYHERGNPDPAYHYANYGYKEQRLPSVLFDGNKYAKFHKLDHDTNPLIHYLQHGMPGMYRIAEYRQNILTKVSLNLPLTLSERIYWLELSYQERLGRPLNLLDKSLALLSEKLYALRAFYNAPDAEKLQNFETMGSFLQERYGLSKEEAPDVVASYANADEVELNKLPTSFRVKCNGLPLRTLYVHNKNGIKIHNLREILKAMQSDALSLNSNYRLTALADIKPQLVFFDYVNDVKDNNAEHANEQSSLDIVVMCCNGKAAFFAFFGPGNAISFYDRDFNLLPTAISNDVQGIHPVVLNHAKPAYLEKLIEKAELISKDYPIMRISFNLYAESFGIDEISLLPDSGNFLFINEYDLRFGSMLDISNYLPK